jgi:hypothetical protein
VFSQPQHKLDASQCSDNYVEPPYLNITYGVMRKTAETSCIANPSIRE